MTTDLFGTAPATLDSITTPKHRGRRAGTLGIVAAAAIALFIGGMGATASAAPPSDATGPTDMSVTVASSIQFTIQSSFALTDGARIVPGSIVAGSVDWSVGTNSTTGYSVSFVPDSADMTSPATADTIPLNTVTWADAQNDPNVPAGISTTSNEVWTQGTKSAPADLPDLGDAHTNDFALTVPFVDSAVYTATLNYTASATE